jgi:thioredoxin-like negative regulator of GroEL
LSDQGWFVLTITPEEYANVVLHPQQKVPIVVYFYATSCEKCPAMRDMVLEVAKETPDAVFFEVDIDQYPELKEKARIKAVPMVALYRKGKVRDFLFGIPDKDRLVRKITMLRDGALPSTVSSV